MFFLPDDEDKYAIIFRADCELTLFVFFFAEAVSFDVSPLLSALHNNMEGGIMHCRYCVLCEANDELDRYRYYYS